MDIIFLIFQMILQGQNAHIFSFTLRLHMAEKTEKQNRSDEEEQQLG